MTVMTVTAVAETVTWTPQTVRFSYFNSRAFYSCDYAEAQTEHFLTLLGARNPDVRCSGGLPETSAVNITAQFAAPSVSTDGVEASWHSVTLKSRESCELNETIVRHVMKRFPTREVTSQSSCWNAEGSFTYEFETLR